MQVMLVLMLFFALIVTVFALQNAAAVPIHVLFWNFKASLALIMVGSAFMGALFSSLLSLFHKKRMTEAEKKPVATTADEQTDGGKSGGTTNMAG